jgi:8-oxo-dGTP pyrophosphatase MutT (NUDIX family)
MDAATPFPPPSVAKPNNSNYPPGVELDNFHYLHANLAEFKVDPSRAHELVSTLQTAHKEKGSGPLIGLWVHGLTSCFLIFETLKANGWKYHRLDAEVDIVHMLYELTPDRHAPASGSASMGVSALLMDEDLNVLWVETYSRPGKKGFPGGVADPGEGPATTVLREVKEELGYTIPDDSHFVMSKVNVVDVFRYGQMDLYVTLQVLLPKGRKLPDPRELKLQEMEIISAGKISFSQLLKDDEGMAEDFVDFETKLLTNAKDFYSKGTTVFGLALQPKIAKKKNLTRYAL